VHERFAMRLRRLQVRSGTYDCDAYICFEAVTRSSWSARCTASGAARSRSREPPRSTRACRLESPRSPATHQATAARAASTASATAARRPSWSARSTAPGAAPSRFPARPSSILASALKSARSPARRPATAAPRGSTPTLGFPARSATASRSWSARSTGPGIKRCQCRACRGSTRATTPGSSRSHVRRRATAVRAGTTQRRR